MPELAEVIFYSGRWAAGLGDGVERVALHPAARVFRQVDRPERLFPRQIEGKTFREARTHGKQLFFRFEDVWLRGHLGMTGKLTYASRDYQAEKHDHLVLGQARGQLVFTDPRMFGNWQLFSAAEMDGIWQGLPPEVTDRRFTRARLSAFLKRRARSPLKAVLLLQEMFPGIGNWMADEVLWRSGLDPRRPAGTLTELETARLWKKLRLVCRQAIRVIGSHWGSPPRATWLFPHRWEDGGRCPCGAPLVRETIGGRTTCWCPTCQEA